MSQFDFDQIEDELGLVVPHIYRMFTTAVEDAGHNLATFRIYHDNATLIEGNWRTRNALSNSEPKWRNHYLDIGVGDGCGNYFFLLATDESDDLAQLWAHDPPGIEQVGSATDFLKDVFAEIKQNFHGSNRYRFQGLMYWDL